MSKFNGREDGLIINKKSGGINPTGCQWIYMYDMVLLSLKMPLSIKKKPRAER